MTDTLRTPDQTRADMAATLLKQMASSGDPVMAANANLALELRGEGPAASPTATGAPAPAPAPAAVPAPTVTPITPAGPTPGPSDEALETLRDANGLLLGKFRTPSELRRSYFGGQNALSATTDEVVRLRNQLATAHPSPAMLPGSAPGDAPRVNPTARPTNLRQEIDDLVKSSEESGQLDPKALLQLVERVADSASTDALNRVLEPRDAMAAADLHMRTNYPTIVNHTQELKNFVVTNPLVGPTVQALMSVGKYEAAMEYAWSMYTVVNGISVEKDVDANSQVAEEERKRARAAAGFSGSPNTGVHAEVAKANQPITQEEKDALNKDSIHDGGAMRRRVLLGNWLPAEWRTWEHQGA